MKNIIWLLSILLLISVARAADIYDLPETINNYFSSTKEGSVIKSQEPDMVKSFSSSINAEIENPSEEIITNDNQYSYGDSGEEQLTYPEDDNDYSLEFDQDISTNEDEEYMAVKAGQIKSGIDDIDYELRKLKRNAANYDSGEYARKLRNLEWQADDLSSKANSIGANNTASSLDDFSYQTRKMRREVQSEPSYYYKERNYDINQGLNKRSWELEDSSSSLNRYNSY